MDSSFGRLLTLLMVTLQSVLLLAGCAQEEPPQEPVIRPVWTIRLAKPSDMSTRTFPGRAKASKEINMSFRVSGPLITLPVDVGDEVKKGDVVSRMDPRDFKTALGTAKGLLGTAKGRLGTAEGEVGTAEGRLGTAEGELAQANAVLKRAEADLLRLEKIFQEDPGATSQLAIDRNRQKRDSAKANVRSAKANVRSAKANITSAKANVSSAKANIRSYQARVASAKDQLSYTWLKAPFDGIVVETYVENFEKVVAKQPILRILDPSSIEFVISVPENLISLTKYVREITVTFDAIPGIDIPAKIKEVGKEASQTTRTYPVTLRMRQPKNAEILPGMAGSARISGQLPDKSKHVGMDIPASAVFSSDGLEKSYVWVVNEDSKTLSRREVTIGGLSNVGTRVTAGLKPGELIVIKGVHSVKEGEEVKIIEASNDGARS